MHCIGTSTAPDPLPPVQINQTSVHVTDFVLMPGTKITGQQQGNIAMMVDFLADPADSFSTQQVSDDGRPASRPTCCRLFSISSAAHVMKLPLHHSSHAPAHARLSSACLRAASRTRSHQLQSKTQVQRRPHHEIRALMSGSALHKAIGFV